MKRVGVAAVLCACSAFGADSSGGAGVDAPDASTSTPPSDAGGGDATPNTTGDSTAGVFACPAGAVQCEDFDHADFSATWTTKPMQLFKLVPNEDPVHRGVGKVLIDTKSWTAPVEDALEKDLSLGGTARTIALDFSVRSDQFPKGQIVEVAKLLADHFLVRVVLATSADDVVSVDLSTFSRDTNQQISTPVQTGVISDHAWHAIHLELTTGDLPAAVQSKYSARVDTLAPKSADVVAPEGKTTTAGVRSVVGISYLTDFVGPTHYAIDDVVVTARPL